MNTRLRVQNEARHAYLRIVVFVHRDVRLLYVEASLIYESRTQSETLRCSP
jgi:hypothetical protein